MFKTSSIHRWVESLPIVRKGLLLMLLPLCFQGLSMILFVALYNRVIEARDSFVHSTEVVETVDVLRASVNKIYYQAVLAVFVSHVEPRFDASSEVPAKQLEKLSGLIRDNSAQTKRVRLLVNQLEQFMALMVELTTSLGPPATDPPAGGTRGQVVRRLFERSLSAKDALDQTVEELRSVELQLQHERKVQVDGAIYRSGTFVAVGFALVTVLTLYLYLLFREAIAARLRTISGNLQRLEVGEILVPTVGGTDEIARLDQAIHSLATALSAKALETEVFLYSVSHDLRSPLVNLSGFTDELRYSSTELREIVQAASAQQPELMRGLEIIDRDFERSFGFLRGGVSRLSKIIDALLKLSRVGRVQYRNELVELNGVVARVLASLENSISRVGANVRCGELPAVYGDETAYEQIFGNLLTNAVTYLDPNRSGVIEVEAVANESIPHLATIVVRDNGLGMSAGAARKLFLAFQRFRPDIASGEGIGLAIVRRVLTTLGGRIWCETQEGVGSSFYVALPKTAEQRVAVPESVVGL